MNIFAISGSASIKSTNVLLLKAISELVKEEHHVEVYSKARELPLFRPEDLINELPKSIINLKEKIKNADAVIIATPEYTHNVPAVLKNIIEWTTASGEFMDKHILPITFTPREPRGQWAMKSLLFSLQTMNAKIVTQLSIYKTDVELHDETITLGEDINLILKEAIKLLA